MLIFGTDRKEVEMRPRLRGGTGDFVRGQPQHQGVMNQTTSNSNEYLKVKIMFVNWLLK